MWKSIIYKEFIKTRNSIAIIAAVFIGVGIYSFMRIYENIRQAGIVSVWEEAIQRDHGMFSYFEYLPLIAGILLAITQYVPELQFKRLKLTLHLPMKEDNILLTMLFFGISVIVALMAVTLIILLWGVSRSFPPEIVTDVFMRLTPWFLAAPASYLIIAWACLEPQWKQRIMNIIPALLFLSLFLLKAKSGSFKYFDSFLIAAIVVSFFFPLYSTARFKEGVQ